MKLERCTLLQHTYFPHALLVILRNSFPVTNVYLLLIQKISTTVQMYFFCNHYIYNLTDSIFVHIIPMAYIKFSRSASGIVFI
jgi:hypothetical protein